MLRSKEDDTDVMLADFGLSRYFGDSIIQTTCGTPTYIAPEILESDSGYGPEVLFSFFLLFGLFKTKIVHHFLFFLILSGGHVGNWCDNLSFVGWLSPLCCRKCCSSLHVCSPSSETNDPLNINSFLG